MSQEQTYFGSYRITGTLGQGAFGIVFQVYQPFLDCQVVIKTLQNFSCFQGVSPTRPYNN